MVSESKEFKVRSRSVPELQKEPTHPAVLAKAISCECREGSPPVVTCIGQASRVIALQGLELAQSQLAQDGLAMVWREDRQVVTLEESGGKALQTRYVVEMNEGDGVIGACDD